MSKTKPATSRKESKTSRQGSRTSETPINIQPGMVVPPPPGLGPPPNVIVTHGLPPSMAYLHGLEEIRIHQILELTEVVIGFERNNRYDINNSLGQKFMHAEEDTNCCTRQICGNIRPFVMNINDVYGNQLMIMHRPLRCQGCLCWCCCLQEMEIQCPPGLHQGTVKEVWTFCIPTYKVYDARDNCVFTIVGDCCYCKCCTDVVFTVYDGETNSGPSDTKILKHWGGCAEMFGSSNDFTIKFPANMDLMKKTLLLGATFLIDFNFFEANHQSS